MNILESIEKALLVSIDNERGVLSAEDSLLELKELADTAGAKTVCVTSQKRDKPHPAFYVGTGKVDELKTLIDETGATVLIADDELTSSQIRNLSKELDIKIIDRTSLILDIFAAHANTSEGKIQVELAQQKYRLSRLTGIGAQMSRLGGGIGTRGPGEKKLETDKRHIREQIGNLTAKLKEIETHRAVLRKSVTRGGAKVVSMVGYTNAGKSTLLNALTDAGVLAENKLFATLDTTTRQIKLSGGSTNVRLTDTVGFISKLPHALVKAFKATLSELNDADVLLHVVDTSNKNHKQQTEVVLGVLRELSCADKPIITAFNKIDLLNGNERDILNETGISENKVFISAANGSGLDALLLKIEDVLKGMKKKVDIFVPFNKGGLLSLIYGKSEIICETHKENGVAISAFVDDDVYNKLQSYNLLEHNAALRL